jgi:hypothetical protein
LLGFLVIVQHGEQFFVGGLGFVVSHFVFRFDRSEGLSDRFGLGWSESDGDVASE